MSDISAWVGEGDVRMAISGVASGLPAGWDTPNLWVDAATGDDDTLKANNTAQTPWATLYRAVKGCAPGGTPDTDEAAVEGDVVEVAAGTYNVAGSESHQISAYNPVNTGSNGNPIVFQTDGGVVNLGLSSGSGATIGAYGVDYITWRGFSIDEANGECLPDTGPVVFWGSIGSRAEYLTIDGDGIPSWGVDNHNGIRVNGCTGIVVQNCTIHTVLHANAANAYHHNGAGVCFYSAVDCVVEHNYIYNCGSAVFFKDKADLDPNDGNIIRYNWIESCSENVVFSYVRDDLPSYVYQNVIIGGVLTTAPTSGFTLYGVNYTGGGVGAADVVAHNTFVDVPYVLVLTSAPSGGGFRWWNNIATGATRNLYVVGTMPADTIVDCEHNVYYDFTNFYQGTDGNRDFASFTGAYADQEQAVGNGLATITTADPMFTDADGGDYTVQAGSPALARGVDLLDLDGDSSTTDAITCGAYITGTETIGREV